MARRTIGRCIVCDQRRALTVDMCDACSDAEEEFQRDHERTMTLEREREIALIAFLSQWAPAYEEAIEDQLSRAFRAGWEAHS